MSEDLISRSVAVEILRARSEMAMGTPKMVFEASAQMLEKLPPVDVELVEHGEWQKEGGIPSCSICHNEAETNHHDRFILSRYCPNCGAKMEGSTE